MSRLLVVAWAAVAAARTSQDPWEAWFRGVSFSLPDMTVGPVKLEDVTVDRIALGDRAASVAPDGERDGAVVWALNVTGIALRLRYVEKLPLRTQQHTTRIHNGTLRVEVALLNATAAAVRACALELPGTDHAAQISAAACGLGPT